METYISFCCFRIYACLRAGGDVGPLDLFGGGIGVELAWFAVAVGPP